MKRKTIILGAGLSGLVAGCALQNNGDDDFIILEACPTPGGLTRTVNVDNFCFDYTGHFLHLAKYKTPEDIPFAHLHNQDWQPVNRHAVCYLSGGFVPAPAQYNIGLIPEPMKSACIDSFNNRPQNQTVADFHEYLIQGFGKTLAQDFLIPQNEKTWGADLKQLSMDAAKRFFPPPDDTKIRQGIAKTKADPISSGYNSSFYYPLNGGIERLINGFARNIRKHICLLRQCVQVDVKNKTILDNYGNKYEYETLISTIPLKTFCALTNDTALQTAAATLTHGGCIAIDLGIKGDLAPELSDVHWIYVPEKDLPFYRVGIYSNVTQGMAPKGCHALYVEIGLTPERQKQSLQTIYLDAIQKLHSLGWINATQIIASVTHIIPCSYIHFNHNYQATVPQLLQTLEEHQIYGLGRYGRWEYTSMEDGIAQAIQLIEKI